MRFIFLAPLQLIALFLGFTLVYEMAVANYNSYEAKGVNYAAQNVLRTSGESLTLLVSRLGEGQWKSVAFVELVCWVYHHRVYYLVLVLLILVLYYEIRFRTVKHPNLSIQPKISADQHREQVRLTTAEELSKLPKTASPEKPAWSEERQRAVQQVLQELMEKQGEIFD